MKCQIFTANEYATAGDHGAIGRHAIEMAANLTAGIGGWPAHYAFVTVSEPSQTSVTINPGVLFVGDKAYALDAAFDVPLQDRVATLPNDTRWVGLLLRGEVVVDKEVRQVRIDADSGETDTRLLDKVERYTIGCVALGGIAGPTPLKPAVPAGECLLAWVLMSQTQIVSVEMNPEHRAKTVYEIEGRLRIVEIQIDALFQTTRTLRTDLGALATQVRGMPSEAITYQLQRRVAAMSRLIDSGVQGEPFSAFFDRGLERDPITGPWDTQHPLWHARVHQGLRHPFAAQNQMRIELQNPANPDVMITDGVLLPKWTPEARLVVSGQDGSEDIASQQVVEIEAIQYEVSMSSTTYGPSFVFCENAREYMGAQGRQVGDTFAAGDRQVQITGLTNHPNNTSTNPEVRESHKQFTGHEVMVSSWSETRWRYETHTFSFNGNHVGQTFLNNQHQYLVAIEPRFTRVASSGDVSLTLCETDRSGGPLVSMVLETKAVPHANLAVGPVPFNLRPSYIEPSRLGFFTSTIGNHALARVNDNKFAEGSHFKLTDGAWAVPDPLKDLVFTVYGAKFEAQRTIVPMRAVTLENGITEIQIRYKGFAPPNTEQVWQIRAPAGEWISLTEAADTPLTGRPVQVELRAIFNGTTTLQPHMILDADAVVIASRPATMMRGPSKPHQFGAAFTNFYAEALIDSWHADLHTAAIKMITGAGNGTVLEPHTTWTEPDMLDPTKIRVRGLFTAPAPISAARIYILTDSTTPIYVPFVENCEMRAIN